MTMKTHGSMTFVMVTGVLATLPLGACHVYVDEPAKTPTATPAPTAAPAPTTKKVIPLRTTHPGAPVTPGAPATPTTPASGATATCLDNAPATVGDCAAVQAPATCTAAPTPRQKCTAYKTYLVPKVAAAAVSCMASLTSAQACDATATAACAHTALAEACPVASLAQLCQIAAAPCKTTAADCTLSLSGLNEQGQQLVAQCVAQGCTAGLTACIDGLTTH